MNLLSPLFILLSHLWHAVAFLRIPGNSISFWIRNQWQGSRVPKLEAHEPKSDLFNYLGDQGKGAEARAEALCQRYQLMALRENSSRYLYRKNLYVLDLLEQSSEGIDFGNAANSVKALDIGPQYWNYVFGLERWLKYWGAPEGREVSLTGIEVDGHRRSHGGVTDAAWAHLHLKQTGNPNVTYQTGDVLQYEGSCFEVITLFYPLVTPYAVLLWGLPFSMYRPQRFLHKIAQLLSPQGNLWVFTHTGAEHQVFRSWAEADGEWELIREGRAQSNLADFYCQVTDRRFSVWKKRC